jgi:plasmid maintenance system antidote protein VapI
VFNEDIHIGKIILSKIKELGINRSELARRINKTRQNIDSIVKRKSIDTQLLMSISNELSHNFLLYYLKENKSKSERVFELLEEKISILENCIDDKNKIISFLENK